MIESIEHKVAVLEVADYIEDNCDVKRFIEYCKVCPNYGTEWVCPPCDFEPLDVIRGYKYVHIVGSRVVVDGQTRHKPSDDKEQRDLSYEILAEARKDIDCRLLELEGGVSRKFSLFCW